MAVPKFNEFIPCIMKLVADGATHNNKELQKYCIDQLHISDVDRKQLLKSGQSMVMNRVYWAKTYLKKAELVVAESSGKIRITENGQKALQTENGEITLAYLKTIPAFIAFQRKDYDTTSSEPQKEIDKTPEEVIEATINDLNNALADDLMKEVMNLESYDFEKLVIKLLIKMGYGSPENEKDMTTPPGGDGGIDGIITADRFGFDVIYTQAKQWQKDSSVGTPEIQKFLGALAGQGATKGIFITTAKFSAGAKNYVKKQLAQKIVLIDGEELMNLMIEYNLGVTTTTTYEIKRIDTDFFTDF